MELKGTLSPRQTLTGNLGSKETLNGGLSTAPGQGTRNYNSLINKPTINAVTVEGDKVSKDYHLQDELGVVSENDIDVIIYG